MTTQQNVTAVFESTIGDIDHIAAQVDRGLELSIQVKKLTAELDALKKNLKAEAALLKLSPDEDGRMRLSGTDGAYVQFSHSVSREVGAVKLRKWLKSRGLLKTFVNYVTVSLSAVDRAFGSEVIREIGTEDLKKYHNITFKRGQLP